MKAPLEMPYSAPSSLVRAAPAVALAAVAYGVIRGSIPAQALLHATIAVVCGASTWPNCRWFGDVILRFPTPRREVWLTIDDGPDREDTPRILDLLEKHAARATFFLVGARAEQNPDCVREIVRRGHGIGQHSHTHPSASFWAALPGRVTQEIDLAQNAIIAAGAPTPQYFRAPVGLANPFVHHAVRRRSLRSVGWSARGFDTLVTQPARVAARISRELSPGTIILLHEGHRDTAGHSYNPACIEAVLTLLKRDGYRCVLPGV